MANFAAMMVSEPRLRIYGYITTTALYYTCFVVGMLFQVANPPRAMVLMLIVTAVLCLLLWESTRWLLLWLRKKWPGSKNLRKRLLAAVAILIPYCIVLSIPRIYVEEGACIYGGSIIVYASFAATAGACLFFSLLQVAVYESIYLFAAWEKARGEAEELKRTNIQVQMDSLKVQIQPHFLFNTLNTLIGLIESDSDRAVYYTEKLAYVYRYLLEASDRSLISLEEELAFTKAYFYLVKTRYPQGLYLDLKEVEQAYAWKIPPLTLQILLENAVKHNVITKKDPLFIRIEFNPLHEQLQVTNNLQRKTVDVSTGKGLLHIKKKYELLNLPGIQVYTTLNTFTVTIPLVKQIAYERTHH